MRKKNYQWEERFGDYITGPADVLGDAEPSGLFPVTTRLFSRLLTNAPDIVLTKQSMRIRRFINPVIRRLARGFLEYKQSYESKNELLGINEPDKPLLLPKEPVIWCGNHGFKDDAGGMVSSIRHSYILFGSLPVFFNTLDGISAYLNGVVLCNRKVRASRRASLDGIITVLQRGTDVMLFPEGIWNKTPEKLLLPFWPGIYRAASATHSKIIPVVQYLADPHKKYDGNVIHTVVGDPVSIEGLSEQEGLMLLRDTISTWYYLLMEKFGQTTRKELLGDNETSAEAWEEYMKIHIGAVKYYDREIELCGDYRPRELARPEDVWRSIADIRELNVNNAQHVLYARRVIELETRRDYQRRF